MNKVLLTLATIFITMNSFAQNYQNNITVNGSHSYSIAPEYSSKMVVSLTNVYYDTQTMSFEEVKSGYLDRLEKAGIKGACFHDLRHDFVTRAMRGGNASHIVMKQVGHKTDSMLRRYQLIDERDLLELRINPLVTTQDQK